MMVIGAVTVLGGGLRRSGGREAASENARDWGSFGLVPGWWDVGLYPGATWEGIMKIMGGCC